MKTLLTSVVLASALLAGCGGSSGDGGVAPTTAVPGSASNSIGGFIEYLKALVVSSADMLEPVDVSAVTPPTDETSEPVAID